jgi:ATP-dependent Clp protease ATP-binding subunit ClpC
MLNDVGITIDGVKGLIEEYEGKGDINLIRNEVPLTPRTKRLLELSLMEARNLNHNYISPEHILLSIIRESEGVAFIILNNLGADFNKLRNDIIAGLKGEQNATNGIISEGSSQPTPTLDKYGRDLNEMARAGKFDPVIGRDEEIQRVLEILCRRTKNNPCLIGDPGVGKTAIAEGLAQKIVAGNIPELLKDKRVVTLDLSSMVAGSK